MAEVVDFVELPTVDFGRWCKLQRVHAPLTLVAASFMDAPLAQHEWEQSLEVPDVTVANVAVTRDVSQYPTHIGEVLLRLGHIFDAPEFSVYFARDRTSPSGLSVSASVSRGDAAVVVADLGERTRLAAVPVGHMVSALVSLQPRLRAARVPTIDFPERIRLDASRSGRHGWDRALMSSRGFSDQDLAELDLIAEQATGGGIIGAFSLRGSTPVASPVGADWVESPAGCAMKFMGRDRSYSISGADKSSLSRAASAALAAARA